MAKSPDGKSLINGFSLDVASTGPVLGPQPAGWLNFDNWEADPNWLQKYNLMVIKLQ